MSRRGCSQLSQPPPGLHVGAVAEVSYPQVRGWGGAPEPELKVDTLLSCNIKSVYLVAHMVTLKTMWNVVEVRYTDEASW